MARANTFTVSPWWHVLLKELQIRPSNVLRHARLPEDLLARHKAGLTTDEYFRFWEGVQLEADDPRVPLRVAEHLSAELFDPAVFAALCSPNLNTALERLSTYKRLICPMALHLGITSKTTTLELEWLEVTAKPPLFLVGMELVFFVQLARMATRAKVFPLKVVSPHSLEPRADYTKFFGVEVKKGKRPKLIFSSEDATRPFLTAKEDMWESFEPHLKKRLSELDESASTADRVHAALLELLPSGNASVEAVSEKLGTSSRTLQRRLNKEEKNFQSVLNGTREELARHYLGTTSLTGAEISFLLGFEDPNSFFRAFHSWTGETPEQVRGTLLAS